MVFEHLYLRGPGVYHGFDRDDKPALDTIPTSGWTGVRHLRVLVHLLASPVADELLHDRITS